MKYHFISVKSIIPRRKTKIQCSSFFPFSRWVDRSFDCKINLDNNLVHQVLKVLMTGQLVAFHKTWKQKAFDSKRFYITNWVYLRYLIFRFNGIKYFIANGCSSSKFDFILISYYNNNNIYTILSYLMIKNTICYLTIFYSPNGLN